MIEMNNVTKVYEIGGEKVYALDGVSLSVNSAEYVSIIGPSGSGKSTMMNIIGCLDTADEGEYVLDGQPIEEYSDDELAVIRNKKIGFVFQQFNLLQKLDALENVELPLLYQGMSQREGRAKATDALERIGLAERLHHKPNELSGGQQQRVAIARAVVTSPSLVLADEPTGNLDHKTGMEILDLFDELHANGSTIIIITHDNAVAQRAGRCLRILDGRLTEGEGA